jgi:CBS domain-containing protein
MKVNPISIRRQATIKQAIAFLTEAGFSGAPVVNEAGQPVGVISKTDLLRHAIDTASEPVAVVAGHDGAALTCGAKQGSHAPSCHHFRTVADIMTPSIVAVPRSASLAQVAAKMTARRVHRVFVVDTTGALIGVVSSLDVLRALCE